MVLLILAAVARFAAAAAQPQHKVQRGLWEGRSIGVSAWSGKRRSTREPARRALLDAVAPKRADALQLLAPEDEALLVGRDALLVLDLGLHIGGRRVARLNLQRRRQAPQRFPQCLVEFCANQQAVRLTAL